MMKREDCFAAWTLNWEVTPEDESVSYSSSLSHTVSFLIYCLLINLWEQEIGVMFFISQFILLQILIVIPFLLKRNKIQGRSMKNMKIKDLYMKKKGRRRRNLFLLFIKGEEERERERKRGREWAGGEENQCWSTNCIGSALRSFHISLFSLLVLNLTIQETIYKC